MFFSCLRS
jgi:photosystem II oxygen-evolving enhancer protein 3